MGQLIPHPREILVKDKTFRVNGSVFKVQSTAEKDVTVKKGGGDFDLISGFKFAIGNHWVEVAEVKGGLIKIKFSD